MNAHESSGRQVSRYRQMTGQQRLQIGLQLFEASVNVAREAIRNQSPDADDRAVEERVKQRIRAGYQIDDSGTPCS